MIDEKHTGWTPPFFVVVCKCGERTEFFREEALRCLKCETLITVIVAGGKDGSG